MTILALTSGDPIRARRLQWSFGTLTVQAAALGRTLVMLMVALPFALPAGALAQTQTPAQVITPADLVGTWAEEGTKAAYMHFQDDSTLVMGPNVYRWHLKNNELVIDSMIQGSSSWGGRFLLELEGQQLRLRISPQGRPRVLVPAAPTAVPWARDLTLTGRAIPCEQGLILNRMDCLNVELLAFLPQDSIANAAGSDLWGWHDSATGREFAMMGRHHTAFIEVTDPIHPRYLGVLPPHAGIVLSPYAAQSVKVYQHYAIIGYEGSDSLGIQVFDLRQLRKVKTPKTFEETAYYNGSLSTHTMALNPETGFAYLNGGNTCGTAMHMVDLRDPLHPTFAGCYRDARFTMGSGYVHDSQCVRYHGPDRRYRGREICVAYAGDVIGVADVTDKQHPQTLSVVSYPNAVAAHQGWFTADHRYIYLDDERDELAIGRTRTIGFDLTDLTDPVVLPDFLHTTHALDHNLYINGRYMYQGNYDAGFRAIDVADPKNLKEVGYLSNIGTTWGTYPFFKHGVVAVSTSDGLYLVRLHHRQR